MLVAEAALLQAVRDHLRNDLALDDSQCDVELDDQVPAIAPKDYFAVIPAGCRPGPNHRSSEGVYDVLLDVRVTMYRRVTEVARDRRRNVFLDLLTGMNLRLESVVRSLDHSYALLATAESIVAQILAGVSPPSSVVANTTGQWPVPFLSFTSDSSPRMVYREPYNAAAMAGQPADPIVAISRGVVFQGVRYMQVRT